MKRKLIGFILSSLLCVIACNKEDDFKEEKKQSPWAENNIIIDSYTLQVNRGNHLTQYVKKVTIDVNEYGYTLSRKIDGDRFDFYEGIGYEQEDGFEYWEGEILTTAPQSSYFIWDKNGAIVDTASVKLPPALGEFTVHSFEYNNETDILTASWERVEGADYYSLIISRDIGWIFYTSEGAQELFPRTTVKNYYDYRIETKKTSLETNLGINNDFCKKYQSDTFWVFLVAVNQSEGEHLVKLGSCQKIYKGKI
ncbi:MAG: hypothetical protein LIO65_08570 [Odoribacter sp.]|nr:hypothetical protein [Odoribacter sp.]